MIQHARYQSGLPDAEPLTPERSAALLTQLGEIQTALFMGHIPLLRKCVWQHLKRSHRNDAGWAEDLESAATKAFWLAIKRVKPQREGFAPFVYFEKCIKGALKREEANALKHQHVNIDDVAHLLVAPPPKIKAETLWNAVDQVSRMFPSEWKVGHILAARSDDKSWSEIARDTGIPIRTCRDRYDRGLAELQKLFDVEPQE